MYVGTMLIVISATNVKIQKSRNSPSQVVHVCRGETQKSWQLVDMDDNTATASEDEPEDGKTKMTKWWMISRMSWKMH